MEPRHRLGPQVGAQPLERPGRAVGVTHREHGRPAAGAEHALDVVRTDRRRGHARTVPDVPGRDRLGRRQLAAGPPRRSPVPGARQPVTRRCASQPWLPRLAAGSAPAAKCATMDARGPGMRLGYGIGMLRVLRLLRVLAMSRLRLTLTLAALAALAACDRDARTAAPPPPTATTAEVPAPTAPRRRPWLDRPWSKPAADARARRLPRRCRSRRTSASTAPGCFASTAGS
jgi:hypothetical protein